MTAIDVNIGLTVKLREAEWLVPALVPLIVIVEGPGGVLAVVTMFNEIEVELFAGGVAELEVSAHVVEGGHPESVKFTVALNPPDEPMVSWELPELP